jgi:hypothetical protein
MVAPARGVPDRKGGFIGISIKDWRVIKTAIAPRQKYVCLIRFSCDIFQTVSKIRNSGVTFECDAKRFSRSVVLAGVYDVDAANPTGVD